jgi:murein tripeptide amidase MpaA
MAPLLRIVVAYPYVPCYRVRYEATAQRWRGNSDMPDVTYDPTYFHTYDELTALLHGWADQYPGLMRVASVGTSHEGRDIWCATVTNHTGVPTNEKPALYVDGNMHAGEVTGCAVALATIHHLLTNYGTDTNVTTLLDARTLYILPRVNPDGAERYLTTPYTLRSSVRPYPETEPDEGLTPEDLNGDGKILTMRVPDAKGEWKISARDPRLMVKRAPGESGGQYYRLYTEGTLNRYVRGPVKIARPLEGLDINRNYPANWSATQRGGGPYPLSEPETRALAQFVIEHPNICGVLNYHTTGGVNLSPPCATSDAGVPLKDREIYKAIGALAAETTGYPYITVYDAFPAIDERGTRSAAGGFIEWTYEGLGIWGISPELWDMVGKAGVSFPDVKQKLLHDPSEEEGLALLKFNDESLNGEGFVDWQPFAHPQLGRVEIGGWDTKRVRQNAPPQFLPEEEEKYTRFTLQYAALTPLVRIGQPEVESLGNGLFIVRALVENHGWLPTHLSDRALRNGIAKPVKVSIAGGEVLMGKQEQEVGHLEGQASATSVLFGNRPGGRVENERLVEWLLRAPDGKPSVTITATSEKGGTHRATVPLT